MIGAGVAVGVGDMTGAGVAVAVGAVRGGGGVAGVGALGGSGGRGGAGGGRSGRPAGAPPRRPGIVTDTSEIVSCRGSVTGDSLLGE